MKRVQELIRASQHSEGKEKELFDQIRELLKTEKGMYAVTARATNNFYMGTVHGRAAAFLFTCREYADSFVSELNWINVETRVIEIMPEQRLAFFSDLYRSGFEAFIIDKGNESLSMSLFTLIERPKPDKKDVSNPELMRFASWYYQARERNRATEMQLHQLETELYGSRFLMPVADAKVMTQPILADNRGGKFFPVFTDWLEFGRYDRKQRFIGETIRFRDFRKLLRHADGIVVNPFGFGHRLSSEDIDRIESEHSSLKVIK